VTRRKLLIRAGLGVLFLLAGAGTWAAMNATALRAAYAARQLRAAAGDDERLEPRHDRIARVAAPRVGQVGGRAAVQRAQLPHAVGTEPLGPAARARQRVVQPPPVLAALGLERREPHAHH
jgi:hypothetical protein